VSSLAEIPVELLVLGLRLLFIAAIYGFLLMVIREIRKDWQRAPRPRSSTFSLVVVCSRSESMPVGQRFPLSPLSTLGRAAEATIRLNDEHVSARHAEITRGSNDTWLVRDAGSTNGTLLNGQRVSGQTQVRPGDLIDLGVVTLRLESQDA
jgi:hypothetical protein